MLACMPRESGDLVCPCPHSLCVDGAAVRLKALVWFWIIDETLVLTSILSVRSDLMRLVHAK